PPSALPGFSGNSFYPTLDGVGASNQSAINGDLYLWSHDESQHCGVISWHAHGANTLREQGGTGSLGGSVTSPTPTPAPFPTGLNATPGYQQVSLSWSGPTGMTYDVKRATVSGGPYTTIVTATPNTNYTSTGLTNGTGYYFVVSPTSTVTNSNEVLAFPFDGIGKAGQLTAGAPDPFQVSS